MKVGHLGFDLLFLNLKFLLFCILYRALPFEDVIRGCKLFRGCKLREFELLIPIDLLFSLSFFGVWVVSKMRSGHSGLLHGGEMPKQYTNICVCLRERERDVYIIFLTKVMLDA